MAYLHPAIVDNRAKFQALYCSQIYTILQPDHYGRMDHSMSSVLFFHLFLYPKNRCYDFPNLWIQSHKRSEIPRILICVLTIVYGDIGVKGCDVQNCFHNRVLMVAGRFVSLNDNLLSMVFPAIFLIFHCRCVVVIFCLLRCPLRSFFFFYP